MNEQLKLRVLAKKHIDYHPEIKRLIDTLDGREKELKEKALACVSILEQILRSNAEDISNSECIADSREFESLSRRIKSLIVLIEEYYVELSYALEALGEKPGYVLPFA